MFSLALAGVILDGEQSEYVTTWKLSQFRNDQFEGERISKATEMCKVGKSMCFTTEILNTDRKNIQNKNQTRD